MNYFILSRLLGLLLLTLGASMLPSLLWSVYYRDHGRLPLLAAMGATLAMGAILYGVGRIRRQDMFRREATAVVGLGWLLCAFAGALPFYFSGTFPTFVDCYFESMSGFTTTGASVMVAERYSEVSAGVHFWRCFTHWLGGMGIIVLFVAVLPFLGAGGRALLKYEVPGPVTEALTPRVKDTAKALWLIYCLLTVLQTVILMLCGFSLFDALCHTFATLATGGFSTHPASVGGFGNLAAEITIMVFMIAAGTNFALYYGIIRGRRHALLTDPEWRLYMGIIVVSLAFSTFALSRSGLYATLGESLRYGVFQVLSLMTTTGFATANFDLWPVSVKCVLLTLMFIGGCAGSTGGGIKVMRWMILLKVTLAHLETIYSPRTVRKLRFGGAVLPDELKSSTMIFFFIWILVFVSGTIAVGILEGGEAGSSYEHGVHIITVATSVIATLNNIGPGLGIVGAEGNYADFGQVTKMLLAFFMVLGRLELYTILVLLVPKFWRTA